MEGHGLTVGRTARLEGRHVGDVVVRAADLGQRSVPLVDGVLLDEGHIDDDRIGRQKGQGREGRGADGESLAGGGGGVAERIEHVGPLPDERRLSGHLGVAAGVVGDGPVGVRRQRNAERAEHADGGDADAVEAQKEVLVASAEAEGEQDRRDDHHQRSPGGLHAFGDAGDDHRGMTGLGLLGDALRRSVLVGGVVLGCEGDDQSSGQSGGDGQGRLPPGVVHGDRRILEQEPEQDARTDGHQGRCEPHAHVQSLEELAEGCTFLGPDHEDAQQRADDAETGEGHRSRSEDVGHPVGHFPERTGECRRGSQRHRGEDGTVVGLVEVGTHAGDVAHVVTDVVGDRGGVAGIVLGDAGFDLADQVGTDVGGLGVDAATDAGEECLRGGTHAVGQHDGGDLLEAGVRDDLVPEEEPGTGIEQGEAHDDKAHHGTGAEGHSQAVVERLLGRPGRAGRGVGRHLHAEPAAQA